MSHPGGTPLAVLLAPREPPPAAQVHTAVRTGRQGQRPCGQRVLPHTCAVCHVRPAPAPLTLVSVTQAVFTLLLGPFTFFDVQKTKYLQILTSLMRWVGE